MSTIADPIFVQAEVAYRRERMLAGTVAGRAAGGRHHAGLVREALRTVRTGHRRARTSPRPA
ncbi:hypothetical protein GCM10027517_27660 [Phycicoccus ginsengisoli]